jgi:hypothetical protein
MEPQELRSLLCDVEEYLAKEDGPHPHRYKRLDPRSLLGRARTLLRQTETFIQEMDDVDTYNYCTCWRDIDKDDEFDNDDILA